MADISKINAVAIGSVAKLDAVLAANIAKVNGLVFSSAPAFSGLLDTYTGAAAAYSTRRLNGQYTGAAMRVREDSGDTETDIGFDANGNLDTAAIATHCGSANGYVTKWYDQAASGGTGSGNVAEQTTEGSQPQIYNGSAVITENGKPALQSDGINDHLIFSDVTSTDFCFINVQTWHATDMGYGGASGTFAAYGLSTNLTRWRLSGVTSNFSFSASNGLQYLAVANRASNSLQVHFNGSSGGTYTNSGSAVLNTLMAGNATSFNLNGRTQEFIIYSSDQSSNRSGIEGNVNAYFQIGNFGTPTSGLLSTYTGAAAAYSVRQLANTAALSMRVRRDNDDAEQDFGFDTNGDLDTAAIATFVGSGNNGYVSKWYDQSGNQNDAAQTTNGSQPQIYNGSAVITENGKPAVDFDGSNNHFDISWTQSASNYSLHAVTKNDSTASFLFDSNTGRLVFDGRGGSRGVYFDGSWKGTMHSGTAQQLQSIYAIAPSSGQSYVDGSQINTGLSYSQKAIGGATVLGGEKGGGAFLFNGTMQEWILYPSDQSSNRSGIETDINNYFSIY